MVVDLFAGAGLLSSAFRREGYEVVRALELELAAARTYAHNLGHHVEVADVRRVRPQGHCDVLIAGPPCQGFSTLGKSRRAYVGTSRSKANASRREDRSEKGDRRASLHVARWARALRPQVIVIENVGSFLESEEWRVLCRRLERDGYQITSGILNAVDFGVPQLRIRSFTIASLGTRVDLPRPRRSDQLTVRDAWEGLSLVPDNVNNHYAPKPSDLALARIRLIRPGGNRRDVMERAPHLTPRSWWTIERQAAADVWGRMRWDAPSNTLRTALQNPSKGRYIHPQQHRVISLREAARLQSIPDGFEFLGRPYQVARQIGNSVPPLVGRAVARQVMRALR